MTRVQLEELAKRATDYLSSGGLFNPELADHQAVSVLIRECRDAFRSMLAQEPVAWMFVTRDRKRGQRHEFAAIDWVPDPDSSEEFVSKEPLYAAPVPAVDPEWKAEAMRLADEYASEAEQDGYRNVIASSHIVEARAALAAHLDKLGVK